MMAEEACIRYDVKVERENHNVYEKIKLQLLSPIVNEGTVVRTKSIPKIFAGPGYTGSIRDHHRALLIK